jgi:hypothetical protein
MSLFTLNDISKKPSVRTESGLVSVTGNPSFRIGNANAKLQEVFGSISQDRILPFVSLGDWSTHDLLFFLLEQTGPARVYFTTWAISEYAIRQLYNLIGQGMILELKGIFDYRNGIRKPAELQFLEKISTEIKPAKCHAKVTVLENENWGISIVGSANFTRNPRIEAGVIFTMKEVAAFERNWIEKELSNKSVFNGND